MDEKEGKEYLQQQWNDYDLYNGWMWEAAKQQQKKSQPVTICQAEGQEGRSIAGNRRCYNSNEEYNKIAKS